MAEFSNYYENKIIDHMLRAVAFTVPTTAYVGLFTTSAGLETDLPTGEVSLGAYARQAAGLSTASGGASANAATVTFPTATANWGTVNHCALVDHVSAANWSTGVHVLMWSPLDAAKTVDSGDTFRINLGDLDVTVA